MESYLHSETVFVTLTYDPEHLPADGNVNETDPQLFLKRLRQRLARENDQPRRIRYFLCAEYGGQLGRAHYHAVLYGCSMLDHETIQNSWGLGGVLVQPFNTARARYTAKYIQKKLIKGGEKFNEDGRRSEFARMSRNPGLGHDFIKSLAYGLKGQATNPDVNLRGLVRLDGRKYPLDRYGKNMLHAALVDLGVSNADAKRMVYPTETEGDPQNDGLSAFDKTQSKIDRQDKYLAQAESRERVTRTRGHRLH